MFPSFEMQLNIDCDSFSVELIKKTVMPPRMLNRVVGAIVFLVMQIEAKKCPPIEGRGRVLLEYVLCLP